MADTAMRSTNLEAIVNASTLRFCPSPSPRSLLECTVPLAARTALDGQYLRVAIRDAGLVSRLRRERPLAYWRSIIEPGGRVQLVQQRWACRDTQGRPFD